MPIPIEFNIVIAENDDNDAALIQTGNPFLRVDDQVDMVWVWRPGWKAAEQCFPEKIIMEDVVGGQMFTGLYRDLIGFFAGSLFFSTVDRQFPTPGDEPRMNDPRTDQMMLTALLQSSAAGGDAVTLRSEWTPEPTPEFPDAGSLTVRLKVL